MDEVFKRHFEDISNQVDNDRNPHTYDIAPGDFYEVDSDEGLFSRFLPRISPTFSQDFRIPQVGRLDMLLASMSGSQDDAVEEEHVETHDVTRDLMDLFEPLGKEVDQVLDISPIVEGDGIETVTKKKKKKKNHRKAKKKVDVVERKEEDLVEAAVDEDIIEPRDVKLAASTLIEQNDSKIDLDDDLDLKIPPSIVESIEPIPTIISLPAKPAPIIKHTPFVPHCLKISSLVPDFCYPGILAELQKDGLYTLAGLNRY
jgi:hypothetical protein